jgi:hypothetical protein
VAPNKPVADGLGQRVINSIHRSPWFRQLGFSGTWKGKEKLATFEIFKMVLAASSAPEYNGVNTVLLRTGQDPSDLAVGAETPLKEV